MSRKIRAMIRKVMLLMLLAAGVVAVIPASAQQPRQVMLDRVVAVVGGAKEGAEAIYDHGVTAIFTTNRLPEPFTGDPQKSKLNLEFTFDNSIGDI